MGQCEPVVYTCQRLIHCRGFFPARVMVSAYVCQRNQSYRLEQRTFLREQTDKKTLQIQAIGLSLYEPVEGGTAEQIGQEVVRTQWLGPDAGKLLVGKRTLIVDEVDDTRKTLQSVPSYCRYTII